MSVTILMLFCINYLIMVYNIQLDCHSTIVVVVVVVVVLVVVVVVVVVVKYTAVT